MAIGWGHDYSFVDKMFSTYFSESLKKLGGVKYNNWYPFKSPKGRWMAFHNTSYGDIRIVDLEANTVVATNFYSNFDVRPDAPKWYMHHTNVASYVPGFIQYDDTLNDDKPVVFTLEDREMTSWLEDGSLVSIYKECLSVEADPSEQELISFVFDKWQSTNFALNAYTYWAADFEFYVDILDLSRIDEGILAIYPKPTYVMPIDTDNLRSMVKFEVESFLPLSKPDENGVQKVLHDEPRSYAYSFEFLEKVQNFRATSSKTYNPYGKNENYAADATPPWRKQLQDEKQRKEEELAKSATVVKDP